MQTFVLIINLKRLIPLEKCSSVDLWFGNWIEIENNTWARRDIEFLFECSNRCLTSGIERVRCRVEHEKTNSISLRMFSAVEIPIKHSSLYNESSFLWFITSRVAVLQEVPTTWTQARKSVSSNLELTCGTKIQSCLIFILDYFGE